MHIKGTVRVVSGFLVFFLGLIKTMPGGFAASSLLTGCISGVRTLDMLFGVLMLVMAVWLILSIRSRVIAAFGGVMLVIQLLLCAITPQGHSGVHLPLFDMVYFTLTMAGLTIVTAYGGGRSALVCMGWRNVFL